MTRPPSTERKCPSRTVASCERRNVNEPGTQITTPIRQSVTERPVENETICVRNAGPLSPISVEKAVRDVTPFHEESRRFQRFTLVFDFEVSRALNRFSRVFHQRRFGRGGNNAISRALDWFFTALRLSAGDNRISVGRRFLRFFPGK